MNDKVSKVSLYCCGLSKLMRLPSAAGIIPSYGLGLSIGLFKKLSINSFLSDIYLFHGCTFLDWNRHIKTSLAALQLCLAFLNFCAIASVPLQAGFMA
jgi:hypothetical protein